MTEDTKKKPRGCLRVFLGLVALIFIAFAALMIVSVRSHERADANAKELCAAIPVGSTLESARVAALRVQAKEIPYPEGTHRFVFHGAVMHQAECALEVTNGVVTKKGFQVEDY